MNFLNLIFALFVAMNAAFAQDSLNVSVLFHWDDPTIHIMPWSLWKKQRRKWFPYASRL